MADVFGWVGASRAAKVRDHVDAVFEAWWSDWARVNPAPTRLIGTQSTCTEDSAGHWVLQSHRGVGFTVPDGFCHALTAVPAEEHGGELAQHIAVSALTDLACRLAGFLSDKEALIRVDVLPSDLHDERLGSSCHAYGSDCPLMIHINRALTDQISPPSEHLRTPGSSRLVALEHTSVKIRAELDLGAIGLSELRDMRAGDILATSTPLTALPWLISDAGTRLMEGHLGARNGRRALGLHQFDESQRKHP